MKIAILFWFYKDADLCLNRLKLLRKFNRKLPIFGLFGGDSAEVGLFAGKLGPVLEDFCACCNERDSDWKWRNGDAMIAEWYRRRGGELEWDSVVVVQWDMLILTDLSLLLADLKPGQLMVSGLRPIEEVLGWWNWVVRDREEYLQFLKELGARFGVEAPVYCCQFVFVCLPKVFMEAYGQLPLEHGFIEYRLPTYAHALGMELSDCPRLPCHWAGDPLHKESPSGRVTLTAQKIPIDLSTIALNLLNPGGTRVFHPYNRVFPADLRSTLELFVEVVRGRWARLALSAKPAANADRALRG